jgi:UDP-N-acetylglucosamine:LPS N-acetylglucosamine transferase
MKKQIKIGLISSRGGHLYQTLRLRPFWKKYKRFWVTDQGQDTDYYLKNEKIYFGFFPDSRNIINAVKNIFLAIKILGREKPNVLISTGAGVALPFFIIGKFVFKSKLIFIEPYDFVKYPSLTGRIVYNFVDLFLIQHSIQKKWYPKAKNWGSLL